MAMHTNLVVKDFDFSDALRLTSQERMRSCVERVRNRLHDNGDWGVFGLPPVPEVGASEEELKELEAQLGMRLPQEYRQFLQDWRYLAIEDGLQVWGFPQGGIGIGTPWVSDEHRLGVTYLVFGYYWGFADGDQLMFDLSESNQEVVLYLHEHGLLYESFAPSFSLALWRMVDEWEN